MKTHYVFPTPFYEFDLSDLTEKLLEMIAEEPNSSSANYPSITQTNDQILHEDEKWKFLKDRIEDCLLEIQKTDGYDPAFGHLRISRLWANISLKSSGAEHTQHRHPMSLLSGILYLTEGSSTKFMDPCYARSLSGVEIPNDKLFDHLLIPPMPGKMIIFPSYVQHLTMPHYSQDNHRITMAWNSLPERMVP